MAAPFQRFANLRVVVNLAVEGYAVGPIVDFHGLISGCGHIQNCQAAVPKPYGGTRFMGCAVFLLRDFYSRLVARTRICEAEPARPSVANQLSHRNKGPGVKPFERDDAGYATHRGFITSV